MAKTLDSSEDEFVELEEDDGEIVVIKSVSQLLKETNVELDRRQVIHKSSHNNINI